jgi:hypothetical protein
MKYSKIHKAFQEFLKENYVVTDEQAIEIANGMEYFLQESLMPTIVSDQGLVEKDA